MTREPDRTICRNRKAPFRFEFIERIECGIVLRGCEVKSLRQGGVSLDESYARIEGGELWLIGFHIPPYAHDTSGVHEPTRRRKLLVHNRELHKLRPKLEQKGLTLVPLRAYFNERGVAKLELALARGKSHGDRRRTIQEREHRREIDRTLRRR
jgi:SsrA-binding protein